MVVRLTPVNRIQVIFSRLWVTTCMFSKYSLFSLLPKFADALQKGRQRDLMHGDVSVVFRLTPVNMQLSLSSLRV